MLDNPVLIVVSGQEIAKSVKWKVWHFILCFCSDFETSVQLFSKTLNMVSYLQLKI